MARRLQVHRHAMARPGDGSFIPEALEWAVAGLPAFPRWLD